VCLAGDDKMIAVNMLSSTGKGARKWPCHDLDQHFSRFLNTLTLKYCEASTLMLNRVHLNTQILNISPPAISL
jgi:hypothetical protein